MPETPDLETEMIYVYHMLKSNFVGDTIFPLNDLKSDLPEVYASHIEKYKGREEVMNIPVPILNCLWNDVVHLSPLHHRIAMEEMSKLGPSTIVRTERIVKIPIPRLDPQKTIYFFPDRDVVEYKYEAKHFGPFDPSTYTELKTPSPEQYEDWKYLVANKMPVLVFGCTTHVLHKGPISIKGLEVEEFSVLKLG